jgi:coenzyme PQQ synthesis protein D (PqqD)
MNKQAGEKESNVKIGGTLSTHSVVTAADQQVFSDVAGETVILNLVLGKYYGLDRVGSSIWNLLQKPRRVSEIRDALIVEYAVEPDRCEHDLLNLLEALAANELITIRDEAA